MFFDSIRLVITIELTILPIIINNPIVVQNCMKFHVIHCIMSNSHGYLNKRREDHDDNICFWLWKKKICQICQHTSTTHAKIPTYLNTKGYSSVKCHSFLFLLPRLWWMMNCWDHWTDIVCTNLYYVHKYENISHFRIYPCCGLSNHKQNIKCSSITFTLVIKNIRGWFIKYFVPIIIIVTTTTTSTAVD